MTGVLVLAVNGDVDDDVSDIKPENLLIRFDDVLKLCDFGQ